MNGADLTYLGRLVEELLGKQILIWIRINGEVVRVKVQEGVKLFIFENVYF